MRDLASHGPLQGSDTWWRNGRKLRGGDLKVSRPHQRLGKVNGIFDNADEHQHVTMADKTERHGSQVAARRPVLADEALLHVRGGRDECGTLPAPRGKPATQVLGV